MPLLAVRSKDRQRSGYLIAYLAPTTANVNERRKGLAYLYYSWA